MPNFICGARLPIFCEYIVAYKKKHIADLIRNSSGHWSYIGSSEYSYMGIGVEYREGSTYGWYACVMVGTVNYG